MLISCLQRGLEELIWGWLDYYYDSDHVLYVLCLLKQKLGYIPEIKSSELFSPEKTNHDLQQCQQEKKKKKKFLLAE